MTYQNILVETRDRTGVIRLNRPQRMNALNDALMTELGHALAAFDADAGIGAIVITGNEKAFAAGADIGAMAEWDYQKVYRDNYITANWEGVRCPCCGNTDLLRIHRQLLGRRLHGPHESRIVPCR